MFRLVCKVQNYAWGKVGLDSEVAKLKVRRPQLHRVRAAGRAPPSAVAFPPAAPGCLASCEMLASDRRVACIAGLARKLRSLAPSTPQHPMPSTGACSCAPRCVAASFSRSHVVGSPPDWIMFVRFGTHPNGPSSIVIPGSDGAEDEVVPLQDWLKAHPDALGGEAVAALCEGDSALPYLFKVLSINKALSIQAHPAKERASILHGERPDVYKDGNHKPEMTCALTPMDAMCGFRSAPEIAEHLRTVPELRAMCGEEGKRPCAARAASAVSLTSSIGAASEAFVAESKASEDGSVEPATLKGLFTSYMTCEPAVVAEQSAALASRLDSAPAGTLSSTDAHALRLTREYPGDVGVVAPYVLNCVTLSPGQGLFLAANEPHAYMSGDCFEIMACSDNVVRAGLTPKLRDVDTLCDILTYRYGAIAPL